MLLGFLIILLIAVAPLMIVLIGAGWFSTTTVGSSLTEVFNYTTSFGLGIIILGIIWLVFILLEAFIMFALFVWNGKRKRNLILAIAVSAVGTGIVPFFTWQWVLPYNMCAPTACVEWTLCMVIMLITIATQHKNMQNSFEKSSSRDKKSTDKHSHNGYHFKAGQAEYDRASKLSASQETQESLLPRSDEEVVSSRSIPASIISKDNDLQVSDFPLGTKILHETYGLGTVIDTQDRGRNSTITVDFGSAGIKRLMLRVAPIKRL